jgi:hypothetical protein
MPNVKMEGILWKKNCKASPTLSAIEALFGNIKARYKVFNRKNKFANIDRSIVQAFESIKEKDIFGAFRLSLKYMIRGYQKKNIFVTTSKLKEEHNECLNGLK